MRFNYGSGCPKRRLRIRVAFLDAAQGIPAYTERAVPVH
jgi:hypothetical protein